MDYNRQKFSEILPKNLIFRIKQILKNYLSFDEKITYIKKCFILLFSFY